MRLHISANKIGVALDYLPILRNMLTKPLIKKGTDGIKEVIDIMNDYFLTRDDFDTIIEIGTWKSQTDPMSLIDSKVKAAFTRAFNKESHLNPFCVVNIKKLKGTKSNEEEDYEAEENDEEEEDDITADSMIKVKKPSAKAVKRSAAKIESSNDQVKPAKKSKKV